MGMNIDTVMFNPTKDCSAGGLYFCEESQCHLFWMYYGTNLARITIPDDARVYIEPDKFKADKIIITSIIDFDHIDDSFWINMIQQSNNIHAINNSRGLYLLSYIRQLPEDIAIRVVQVNGLALQFINAKNQTPNICITAVTQNGLALEYVDYSLMTNQICEIAINQNGMAIRYVKAPTPQLCKLAVKRNGFALSYIDEQNQTDEICEMAVQQQGFALRYVKKQTPKICKLAIAQNYWSRELVNILVEAF